MSDGTTHVLLVSSAVSNGFMMFHGESYSEKRHIYYSSATAVATTAAATTTPTTDKQQERRPTTPWSVECDLMGPVNGTVELLLVHFKYIRYQKSLPCSSETVVQFGRAQQAE